MTNIVVRPFGYTGVAEEIVWVQGDNVPVTAYLWGGGGAGGGNDSARGGTGSGGGFARVSFVISDNDVIRLAVGGPGGRGASGRSGSGGGSAGGSYTESPVFNTRDAITSPPAYPQFNSAYCTFLNTYGIWGNPSSGALFDRNWNITFPTTGNYTFTMSVDNIAELYIDNVVVFYCDSFGTTFEQVFNLSAGVHNIRIRAQNTGGPASVALTIDGGSSFSGGRGGNAGGGGSSGAGGGGAGATVLLLNGTLIGVAGGGAGGGGGGNGPTGDSAPGSRGQAIPGANAGQNGTNKSGDGGGGGGGGGGYGGGNGGTTPGGDTGGNAGSNGGNYSAAGVTASSVGQAPAGSAYEYYSPSCGRGGTWTQNGTPGAATLVFELNGTYVNVPGAGFTPVSTTYIKVNDSWNLVKASYIKANGVWVALRGSFAPIFNVYPSLFGINSREASGDSGGGGGGGGKIICTKLYELGLMSKEIYEADQAFGADLVATRPDIYNGYRAWAEIVVDWMDGNGPNMMPWLSEQRRREITQQWSTSWAQEIATPWAEEMAYQMGRRESSNLAGKAIMAIGTPICKVVGVWQRVIGPSKHPAGFVKGLMLIPVFVALKTVAVLGKLFKQG